MGVNYQTGKSRGCLGEMLALQLNDCTLILNDLEQLLDGEPGYPAPLLLHLGRDLHQSFRRLRSRADDLKQHQAEAAGRPTTRGRRP